MSLFYSEIYKFCNAKCIYNAKIIGENDNIVSSIIAKISLNMLLNSLHIIYALC